jgi:hypothetical protein
MILTMIFKGIFEQKSHFTNIIYIFEHIIHMVNIVYQKKRFATH